MSATVTLILGPTGVGKTSYAIELAQRYDAPIINCDSRQIYKELNIGVARPTPQELALAPHYLVATRSIEAPYSAGDFEQEAWELVGRLARTHERILMVGGSGLYAQAFCYGMDPFPEVPPELRQELNAQWDREGGPEVLRAQLAQWDPASYAELDLANRQRVIRALEVCMASGKPFSQFKQRTVKARPLPIEQIGLTRPRAELYRRIDRRVERMMEEGLLEEVRRLYPQRHLPALNTVGYKELFGYLDGQYPLEEAVQLIQRHTRQYAKRQLTYWRRDPSIKWETLS